MPCPAARTTAVWRAKAIHFPSGDGAYQNSGRLSARRLTIPSATRIVARSASICPQRDTVSVDTVSTPAADLAMLSLRCAARYTRTLAPGAAVESVERTEAGSTRSAARPGAFGPALSSRAMTDLESGAHLRWANTDGRTGSSASFRIRRVASSHTHTRPTPSRSE